MSSRSSSSVSKPAASSAKSSSSSGSTFSLTSVTVTSKRASRPASSSAAVLVGEASLERALLARGGADQPLLEAGDQAPGAELEELVAALAALERLAVDASPT